MNGLQVVCNDIFPINLDGSTIDYLCDSDPNSEGAKETDEFLYRYGLVLPRPPAKSWYTRRKTRLQPLWLKTRRGKIRPAAFMENYYIDQVELGILKGKLMNPIRADKSYQTIAGNDIGAFIALAFDRPKEFIGTELEIAGSELTNPEAAQVFSRVLGKPVKFQKLPMPMVRLLLGKEFYQMFRWFNQSGFKANIPELRRKYPEVQLQTLEEWLRSEGWHKRARRVRPPKT